MKIDINNYPILNQSQKLLTSLAMQQAYLVLKLPLLELGGWVENQILANPLLEKIEDRSVAPNFDLIQKVPSLYEELMDQVQISDFTKPEIAIAEILIGNLNEKGFLSFPISELFPKARRTKALIVLKMIQQLDPPGIAARDLKESLLLQLEALGEKGSRVYKIIAKSFPNNLPEDVKTRIKKLDFSPGQKFSFHYVQPIQPDIIIENFGAGFKVIYNEEGVPEFELSDLYDDIGPVQYLKEQIVAGKWLIRILGRRAQILEKLSLYLIKNQVSFFKGLIKEPKPLDIKEASHELDIHPSTLARCIENKTLLCNLGLISFRVFFPKTVQFSDGKKMTQKSAKDLLKVLVEKENKKSPLTDEKLSKQIQRLGVPCSRRTVAKYRSLLSIPSARVRRQMNRVTSSAF